MMGDGTMRDYVSIAEVERRARELATQISDEQVARRAADDGERLAILETEMRHVQDAVKQIAKDVSSMKSVFTKASGMWLVLVVIGGGIVFVASQAWNYLNYRGH